MLQRMEKLCAACEDYLADLPTYELDSRKAALIAWCLAYTCPDYDMLPFFWHKAVGTLLISLRLLRVGAGCKERSEEVTKFCIEFLEYLWETRSRMYIALHSRGCWAHCTFDSQVCYDVIWSTWRNL